MVYFRLSVVFIVGVVLQVSTASPIVSDATDSVFSENELKIAKAAGLSERSLAEGTKTGFTVEEIVKITEYVSNSDPMSRKKVTFDYMTKICDIVEAQHKTATNYTSAQETHLRDLIELMSIVLSHDLAPYVRSTLCGYVSQPDSLDEEAKSFGLEVVPYMGLRYLKLKAQKVSDNERAIVAKEMCCIYKNLDERVTLQISKFGGLSDEDLNGFDQQWKEFEATNTSKSLENVCDFLHDKNSDDDECAISVPIDGPVEEPQ